VSFVGCGAPLAAANGKKAQVVAHHHALYGMDGALACIDPARTAWADVLAAASGPAAPDLGSGARLESDMPLMTVLLTLIVVGVLLWLVNTYIPMDGKIKRILNVVAVIGVVLWVLNVFGLFGPLGNVRVGRS
jgi:hypothetical protein